MKDWLQRRWYADVPPPVGLRPFAAIFGFVASRRRAHARPDAPIGVPVIVVGNIAVGGTGKTPLVIWLAERLRAWGWRPGVIARGYGGRASSYPLAVDAETPALEAGDEPVLIARRTGVPVMVDPRRVRAARALAASGTVDVLISDDGLQHHALPRDLEICVVDGRRGLGNGALLPAGPLREPASRLDTVDLIAVNGGGFRAGAAPAADFRLVPGDALPLGGGPRRPLDSFCDGDVHAVAGIGDPERFFAMLESRGLRLLRHPFPDHHAFAARDLAFGDGRPILMTEKDAVKCRAIASVPAWAVPVTAELSADAEALVQQSLAALKR